MKYLEEISIDLHTDSGKRKLRVSDNGIGISHFIDFQKMDSLGLKLVNLLSKQIKGEVQVDKQSGTTVEITF